MFHLNSKHLDNVGFIVCIYWTEKRTPTGEDLNVKGQVEATFYPSRKSQYTHNKMCLPYFIEIMNFLFHYFITNSRQFHV